MTQGHRLLAFAGASVLFAALSGCATNEALKQARNADSLREYDVAVAQYMRAVREDPKNPEAALGLERAKLRAAEAHLVRGRRLQSMGRLEDAMLELQLSNELNPTSGDTERELRAVRLAIRDKTATQPEGKTALQVLLAGARDAAPPGHQLPDVALPDNISLARTVQAREAYIMLGQLAGLTVTFDSAFRDGPAQLALLNKQPLRQALDALARGSATFYRVIGPSTIIVVNDTQAKQREYLDEVAQVFYVQNAELEKAQDALRIAADIRTLAPIPGTNAIVVKDTAARVAMAGRLLAAFDKARPEVVVDVEVLEVNRSQLRDIGLQIASPGSAGINGSIFLNEGLTLEDLRGLGASDFLTSNIPALFYRLIKTEGSTRTLANPHLRMADGLAATAKFGEEVPIPKTTITPIVSGGVNIQPQTTFDYRPIGVNISITTRTHANDDVTLGLSIELSTLSGTGFDGLPTIGSRRVDTQITLKDGETNILAGLIREDERTERQVIPGLGSVPVLGNMLFARNTKQATQTDVVIMLTPHVLRPLIITAEDLRPVLVPRDGASSEGVPLAPPNPIIRDIPRPPEDAPVSGGPPAGLPAIPAAVPPKVIIK